MAANTQHQNFLSQYSTGVNDLLNAREKLKALRERSEATGLVQALTPEDFAGALAYLGDATAILGAYEVLDQIEALLTDFTKTPPVPTADLAALLRFRP